MAYIQLNNRTARNYRVIRKPAGYRGPIRELTQILLRGKNTLTEMERELVATIVSFKNNCHFCTKAHAATVIALGGSRELLEKIYHDPENAPLSEKMKALLAIGAKVQESGKSVRPEHISRAKNAGALTARFMILF